MQLPKIIKNLISKSKRKEYFTDDDLTDEEVEDFLVNISATAREINELREEEMLRLRNKLLD